MTTRKLKPAGRVPVIVIPETAEDHEAGQPRELRSAIKDGDRYTVPQRVVLHRSASVGEWVTHRENMNNGEKFWGHYFPAVENKGGELGAFRRAFRDYVRRCRELGVEAFPVRPLAFASYQNGKLETMTAAV